MDLDNKLWLLVVVLGVTACGDAASKGGDGSSSTANSAANSSTCTDCAQSEWETELALCVEVINQYRTDGGLAALQRSADLEECAAAGASSDSASGGPHAHFIETRGCNGTAFAENEVPGWPLARYAGVEDVVRQGAQMMYDEGPGGGHYENIMGDYTGVGCGIVVTSDDAVWVVHDFR